MSVQAGIWNFDGRPVDRQHLAQISDSLKQQGPDGESYYVDGSVALLYRPFHTTTESRREKQPYFSHRGFILTWDGRLDNRDELIPKLRGDLDAEPTDVAIVAASFDRWEENCFLRFIGDWAVSVWKPEQRELILAIDYMAIRHIFYYPKQGCVWWASDLAPLVLQSGDKFNLDDDYIAGYFAHDPDAHLTPYREIREVPAGRFIRIRDGKLLVERYWRFSPKSRIRYKTDREYEEHFRHVLRQSVRRRLRSDSSILAELSGGLDSSSIVCMADDILATEAALTPSLDTISYYDKTEPTGDDWIYFPIVEERRGKIGTHIDVSKASPSHISGDYSDFEALPGSRPFGEDIEIERCRIIKKGGYRAVLSGNGGDEFMGGVPNPTAQLADLIIQLRFVKLVHELTAWSLVKRQPWIRVLWLALTDILPPSLSLYFLEQAKVEPWVDSNFAKRTRLAIRLLDVDEHFGLWLPSRRSSIASALLMANKLAKWKCPTLATEEVRFPYLDQNLIEFVLSIPASQLLRPGERRSLMRRALPGIVPDEILSRNTKQLGGRAVVCSLEKHLESVRSMFVQPLSSRLGYISPSCFLDHVQAALIGKHVHLVRLLRAVSLELWLRDLVSRNLINCSDKDVLPNMRVPSRSSVTC
jgi:asparagine synthase (glutamine-hydrolysing)